MIAYTGIEGSTIVTIDQAKQFCQSVKMKDFYPNIDDIVEIYYRKGKEYNIRFDVAFAISCAVMNCFHYTVTNCNIARIGYQMGYDIPTSFETYEECIDTLYQMMKKFSDKDYVGTCTKEIFKKIDEPNKRFGMKDGFSGHAGSIEELTKIWDPDNLNLNMTEELFLNYVFLVIKTMKEFKPVLPPDYKSSGTATSFKVFVNATAKKSSAVQISERIKSLPFVKNTLPVKIQLQKMYNGGASKAFYVVAVGDFDSVKDARKCLENLHVYSYTGTVTAVIRPKAIEELRENKKGK